MSKKTQIYLSLDRNCIGVHIHNRYNVCWIGFGLKSSEDGIVLANHWHTLPPEASSSVYEFVKALERLPRHTQQGEVPKPYGPFKLKLKPHHNERFLSILSKLTPEKIAPPNGAQPE
jgi:hypothetical protein